MAYDQVILIPGGGGPGTGAREILDLFNHPESMGVKSTDRRWAGWTSGKVQVAEPREATTGYDVAHNVAAAIAHLLEGIRSVELERTADVRVLSTGTRRRRTGWSNLTKGYRDRLERRGISRERWESGADLRAARGHVPRPPRTAAPFAPTMRYLTRQGTDDDARQLRRFEEVRKPGYLPRGLSFDVVAALSQLRGVPRDWSRVQFVPAPDGEPWAMIVSFR